MSNFTYELPNEDRFFNAVMTVLGSDPKRAFLKISIMSYEMDIARFLRPVVTLKEDGMLCTLL